MDIYTGFMIVQNPLLYIRAPWLTEAGVFFALVSAANTILIRQQGRGLTIKSTGCTGSKNTTRRPAYNNGRCTSAGNMLFLQRTQFYDRLSVQRKPVFLK